jgi:transglutaminase-like putative cysteine protease
VTAHAYQVVHRTDYRYEAPVNESYGRTFLRPRDEPGQRVLEHALAVTPQPDEVHARVDYFGNRTSYFRIGTSHQELTVTATSRVEIERVPPSWDELDEARLGEPAWDDTGDVDLAAREFVLPSPMVPSLPVVAAYAHQELTTGRPVGEALRGLMARLHGDFTYEPGATTVSTPLDTLLEQRSGVCQDFAHLMIGCLRAVGLPARYVSGYLLTTPPPGKPRLVGADASHAWVSVLVPGAGWVDLDPTNDARADHRYVVAARGRDYSDVPPLKGIIFTKSKSSTLKVSVDVEPVTSSLF